MTWNPNVIGTRRVRSGRDRRVDHHAQLRHLIDQSVFTVLVEELDSARPPAATGRPRRHGNASLLLLLIAAGSLGSVRRAANFMKSMNRWEAFRRQLHRHFPDDPCLRRGAPSPSRSALNTLKNDLDEAVVKRIADRLSEDAYALADEIGLGVNTGTLLDPTRDAILVGDGVAIRSMTRFTPDDRALNLDTGEIQIRRHDPDAIWNTTGDQRRVWGTPFAQLSASTGIANEHVLFATQPVTKSRNEATAAVEMAAMAKRHLPGFAALAWDKAIRSRHIDRLWDLRIQPLIGVHDKTGRHTDHFPLGEHTINGLIVRLVAHRGAVCIPTLTGDLAPLEPVKLAYRPNRHDGQRVYGTFRVPEGIDCDTRLWNGTVDQRLNSYCRSDVVYGEHVRALTPRSDRWNRLYGLRSLSESMNAWIQARLGPGNRSRSLGRKKQWLDLLALQLLRNDQTRMLHRESVKRESSAAPPRAA